MGIDGKAQLGLCRPGQTSEHLVGSLDHGAAVGTDEMGVGVRSKQVARWTVTEVGVGDDPEVLEVLEIAVDGGQVDVGRPSLHGCGEGLGTHMAVGLEEHLEEDAA